MTKPATAITPKVDALAPLTPEQALAQVPELLAAIPDVTEDPTPRMAAAILTADDPEDWESVFKGRSIKDSAGKQVRILAIRKAPSQFKGVIDQFLIAEIIDLETGEADVMTVSSVMSVLQLLVAHNRGWLPLDVEVMRKATPTRRGFHPIHLKALSKVQQVGAGS
jgi:hypothetical protein